MQTLEINRSTWSTGAARKALEAVNGEGELRHQATGLMCVMGQYLASLGVPPRAMDSRGNLNIEIRELLPQSAEWVAKSKVFDTVTDTNDDEKLHQIRREARLAKLFAAQGVNLTFKGRYADATLLAKRYVREVLH